MAAPITHIVLSEKVRNRLGDLNWDEFLIGTSFPDIRYLRVIKREQTHQNNISFGDIQKEKAFKAGLNFHSLVDRIREDFIKKNNIYEIILNTRTSIQALKLLEDEILYERVSDWSKISSIFNDISSEELQFPIKKEDIQRWHTMLQQYFSSKPNPETRKVLFKEFQFNDFDTEETEKNVFLMKRNPNILDIIERFYENFELLL